MKSALKFLLGIEIVAAVLVFFALLDTSNVLYAIVFAAVAALQTLPILAIMKHMDEIDELYREVNQLRYKLRKHKEYLESQAEGSQPLPLGEDIARGPLYCVKCGAVNKGGTSRCEGCNAKYSPNANPTDNDGESKKVSRWVK